MTIIKFVCYSWQHFVWIKCHKRANLQFVKTLVFKKCEKVVSRVCSFKFKI
jgi:hypothetical protein